MPHRDKVMARCRFRDLDGKVRLIARVAGSETAARRALAVAIRDRQAPAGGEGITANTLVEVLIDRWLEQVDASDRAASTKRLYSMTAERHLRPAFESLRVSEVTVTTVDRFLERVARDSGRGMAKTARSCLSLVLQLAVRRDVLRVNPVSQASPLGSEPRSPVRALTGAEADALMASLLYSSRAIRMDLVDLCAFMLGTGVRIGEACALRLPQVDLEAGTAEISATVTHAGLEERTKSNASWRVIALPKDVLAILRLRVESEAIDTSQAIFSTPLGNRRDPSNTAGDLRAVFDEAGFEWVTSHVFRKTVATRLDAAGQSARQIADHLGHRNPSLTQDVYMGRRVTNAAAATILVRTVNDQ